MKNKEIYISVDIEADGPIPGPFSMTALGASVAGSRSIEGEYTKFDKDTFYTELQPISDDYILDALKVGIYDGFGREKVDADMTGKDIRAYLFEHGENPAVGMNRFVTWLEEMKVKYDAKTVVFAGFPLGFDWTFTYWYLIKFVGSSPFSHGRHIDIKTLFSTKSGKAITDSVKRRMPKHLFSTKPHTHKAVDDAVEQGELLMNILLWNP